MPLQKYEDFLELPIQPFSIALIYAALTAKTVGNLCMMISPSTLLCFLSHVVAKYTNNTWFPILLAIYYT